MRGPLHFCCDTTAISRKLFLRGPLDQQWLPLWEDISQKFTEYLQGNKDVPPHFLGAVVLDQKQVPTTYVERRQIIDGQQRLTTLQVFLSAFRDFCREQKCDQIGAEAENYTLNKGMMGDPDKDKFKVLAHPPRSRSIPRCRREWLAKTVGRTAPPTRRKYARKDNPRPRMVEAYLYFYDQLGEFFIGSADDPPLSADIELLERLGECFQALRNSLHIVSIDLEKDDDAQVIFETLNARGEPLLPADLLRNDIFLRAAQRGENQSQLGREAICICNIFSPVNSVGHILLRLNASYMSHKMEDVVFAGKPTVEHLMPQGWIRAPVRHPGNRESSPARACRRDTRQTP